MTAKNVQRGMAQKVQELSATFRKKQKVYMQSGSRLGATQEIWLIDGSATGARNQEQGSACSVWGHIPSRTRIIRRPRR